MSVAMTISAIKLLNKEKENCDQGQQRLKKKKSCIKQIENLSRFRKSFSR